jgi:hypothetical protein
MSVVAAERKWVAVGETIRGASHQRSELPNQDAVLVSLPAGGSLPAVLAVSDGHGSSKCFRSQEGSRMGVEVAVAELRDFAGSIDSLSLTEIHKSAQQDMPKAIVREWRKRVLVHFQEHPFSSEELEKLDDATRIAIEQGSAKNEPYIAYGATLLSVLMTREFVVFLQLGDGEILIVSERGQVQEPVDVDENLIANETTSLCQDDAWKKFRFRFQVLVESVPALVLLTTDGYANSFATPDGFRQVAADLFNMLETDGVDKVRESLPGWLADASHQGSGDDVSVAILYCEPQGPRPAAEITKTSSNAAAKTEAVAHPPATSFVVQFLDFLYTCYKRARHWFRRHPSVGLISSVLAVVMFVYILLFR